MTHLRQKLPDSRGPGTDHPRRNLVSAPQVPGGRASHGHATVGREMTRAGRLSGRLRLPPAAVQDEFGIAVRLRPTLEDQV
jgi:hypothetical protein